jgi:hypothetical protein
MTTQTTTEALAVVREFVDDIHDNRDAVLGIDGDDRSPWEVADALAVIEAALSGEAALRAEIARLGIELVLISKQSTFPLTEDQS